MVYYYYLCWENITLYKTCRKNKIGALKVQITNVLMKILVIHVEQKRVKINGENGGGMNIKKFFQGVSKFHGTIG